MIQFLICFYSLQLNFCFSVVFLQVHIQYQAGIDSSVNENADGDNSDEVSGNGLFVCQEAGCGKAFNRKDNLKRHSRQHSGVKPFACSYPGCSYASIYRSNTLNHIRHIHLKNLQLAEGEQVPNVIEYLNVKQELL